MLLASLPYSLALRALEERPVAPGIDLGQEQVRPSPTCFTIVVTSFQRPTIAQHVLRAFWPGPRYPGRRSLQGGNTEGARASSRHLAANLTMQAVCKRSGARMKLSVTAAQAALLIGRPAPSSDDHTGAATSAFGR